MIRRFRYWTAKRAPDGAMGHPLSEQIIEAASPSDAVTQARLIDSDLVALGANAICLIDEDGQVLWALRLQDASCTRAD